MNRKLANQRTTTRCGPGRPALLTAALCLLACAAAGAPAGPPVTTAQPAPTTADGLRGVHYQALLGGALRVADALEPGDVVDIFLPRPPFESWDAVEASTTGETCLDLGALSDPGAGYVLVQTATVVGSTGRGLLPGESCATLVHARFRSGGSDWAATVAVWLQRPEAPPFPDDTLAVGLTFSRIEADAVDPADTPARVLLIEITATNHGADPLVLEGLVDAPGLQQAGGVAYRLPPTALIGTVAELQALVGAVAGLTLAPGESVRLGLLVDAPGELARARGTLTVQPALLVTRGDETFSFRLDRVSTTWGEELP